MTPSSYFDGILLIVLDDFLSMLGLRKLANLLYGNLLERLKKHESDVYYEVKSVPLLGGRLSPDL